MSTQVVVFHPDAKVKAEDGEVISYEFKGNCEPYIVIGSYSYIHYGMECIVKNLKPSTPIYGIDNAIEFKTIKEYLKHIKKL